MGLVVVGALGGVAARLGRFTNSYRALLTVTKTGRYFRSGVRILLVEPAGSVGAAGKLYYAADASSKGRRRAAFGRDLLAGNLYASPELDTQAGSSGGGDSAPQPPYGPNPGGGGGGGRKGDKPAHVKHRRK